MCEDLNALNGREEYIMDCYKIFDWEEGQSKTCLRLLEKIKLTTLLTVSGHETNYFQPQQR